MKDDVELLNAFVKNRDETSFRELVNRRIGFVYAINLRRLRDPHLAQDATQAVFVALARKAASVAHCPSVLGWLHRCSCYESLNLMRAQTNRLARETEAERLGTTTGGPLPSENPDALVGLLDEVLNELPEADREIIIARYFSDFSYAKIGGQTGRSENASRMRADRALARLRDKLESRGFTSASAVLAGLLPSYATAAVPSGLAATVANTALTTLGTGALATSLLFSMSTTKILTVAAAFTTMAFIGFEAYQNHNPQRDQDDLRRQNAQATESDRASKKQLSVRAPKPADATSPAEVIPPDEKTRSHLESIAHQPAAGITRTAPAGWIKNGSDTKAFEVGVDPGHSFGGIASAYVKSTDDASAEKKFGGMMQSTSAEQYKNQRVRMTGWIKTEDANDGGGHLWLRVDGGQRGGNPLAFDNMDRRAPKGTTDWQEYSIVLDVPNEATSLNYGFFLAGKGQIWVNGVSIERVTPDVPTTNMIRPPKPLPTAPVNLDFNPNAASGG